jgi:HEPN domain-containing protein
MKSINQSAYAGPRRRRFRWICWFAHRRIYSVAWPMATGSCARSLAEARFSMTKMTAEWLRKAEGDVGMARRLAAGKSSYPDGVCFHSQQAAEKFLKALLQEASLAVPRTHELIDLLAMLLPLHKELRPLRRGLDFLTRFSVDPRYPGFTASKSQAQSALRWIGRVRNICRGILGLPARRSTTKKSK